MAMVRSATQLRQFLCQIVAPHVHGIESAASSVAGGNLGAMGTARSRFHEGRAVSKGDCVAQGLPLRVDELPEQHSLSRSSVGDIAEVAVRKVPL